MTNKRIRSQKFFKNKKQKNLKMIFQRNLIKAERFLKLKILPNKLSKNNFQIRISNRLLFKSVNIINIIYLLIIFLFQQSNYVDGCKNEKNLRI